MTATEIIQTIDNTNFRFYGITSRDAKYQVGDDNLEQSFYWVPTEGRKTEEYIGGVCATRIDTTFCGCCEVDERAIAAVEEALKTNNRYGCDHQYLLGSDYLVDETVEADDPGEIILDEPVVLAIIK